MDILNLNAISQGKFSTDCKNCDRNVIDVCSMSEKVIFRTSLKKQIHKTQALDKSSYPTDTNIKKRVSFTDLLANMNEKDFGMEQPGNDIRDESQFVSDNSNENPLGKKGNFEYESPITLRKNESNVISKMSSDNRRSFDFMVIQPPTPPNARHTIKTNFIQ